MNKRTIVIFLSLYACVLSTPQLHSMSAAGAGAAQPVLAPKPTSLLPNHITYLAARLGFKIAGEHEQYQKAVSKYLNEGGDANAVNCEEKTLLHYAAQEGDAALAILLINLGANIEARDITQRTPFLDALGLAIHPETKIPVIKVLIDAGVDISGMTLASMGAPQAKSRALVNASNGAIDHRYSLVTFVTSYIVQCKVKIKEAITKALSSLDHMQEPHIQQALSDFLYGPSEQENREFELMKKDIFDSVRMQRHKTTRLEYLLSRCPYLLAKRDESGHTLLSFALFVKADTARAMIELQQKKREEHIKRFDEKIKKDLAEQQTAQKETLKQAALANDVKAIAEIDSAQINVRYDHNKTALILAAERGHEQVVDALLAKRANFALLDNAFNSALHYATQFGHKNVVQRLLKDIPLQGAPANVLREITNAHKLADNVEKVTVIHKELYKQIKELLAPYVAQAQEQPAPK